MFNRNSLTPSSVMPLHSNSIRAILLLGNRVDIDHRFNTHNLLSSLQELLHISKQKAKAVIHELQFYRFIRKDEDGHYYSLFTKKYEKGMTDYAYIPYFRFFNEYESLFLSMKERELKLFLYVLTRKQAGIFHQISVEHLYKNKTFEKKNVLPFFHSQKEVAHYLHRLISKQLLQIRFFYKGENVIWDTQNAEEGFNLFNEFCGKIEKGKRKKRFGLSRHKIELRIHPILLIGKKNEYTLEEREFMSGRSLKKDLYFLKNHQQRQIQVQSVYEAHSSLFELKTIAMEHGYNLEHLAAEYPDFVAHVHQLKLELWKQFGRIGIELYREALTSYFSNQEHRFLEDVLEDKFTSILKNYYILPTLQKEFLTHAQCLLKNQQERGFISHAVIKEQKEYANAIAQYFNQQSFFDRSVVLHHAIECMEGMNLTFLTQELPEFKVLHERVMSVYKTELQKGMDKETVLSLALSNRLQAKHSKIATSSTDSTRSNNQKNKGEISPGWKDSL